LPCWKVTAILSNMENMIGLPTPEEASNALTDAEASRLLLARSIALPSFFYGSIGTAIATQIATTAIGLANAGAWARWLLLAGVVAFAMVAGIQLTRFRRLNGVWLGGFASRVVFGAAAAASTSYALAATAAILAAFAGRWWLVATCSLAGGVAYALSGRRWVRIYRAEPATHSRGESAAWLAALCLLAVAGLVLLVIGS
jgi:hypothetical protein